MVANTFTTHDVKVDDATISLIRSGVIKAHLLETDRCILSGDLLIFYQWDRKDRRAVGGLCCVGVKHVTFYSDCGGSFLTASQCLVHFEADACPPTVLV